MPATNRLTLLGDSLVELLDVLGGSILLEFDNVLSCLQDIAVQNRTFSPVASGMTAIYSHMAYLLCLRGSRLRARRYPIDPCLLAKLLFFKDERR
jgi:hypothetical protein